MGDVVSLIAKKPDRFVSGLFRCSVCKHEWSGVVPAGVVDGCECPECGLHRGMSVHPVVPGELFKCDCSGELYYLTREGASCRECGALADGWQD